jgi:signal peptidase II
MAWGTEIPGAYGKLFLTLFRLVAVGGIGYWLWDSVERKTVQIT